MVASFQKVKKAVECDMSSPIAFVPSPYEQQADEQGNGEDSQ
jgi:hypothetical protein